jgi:hypothetical protein
MGDYVRKELNGGNETIWDIIHVHMEETLCIATLSKIYLFSKKKKGQEGKTGTVWELVPVGKGSI